MLETLEQRIHRFERTTDIILRHPMSSTFAELIERSRNDFKGFRLLYSTDNLDSNFGGVLLSSIEDICPAISRYFGASGLLFYDDEIYEEVQNIGAISFPLDYSVSFDTQVAEAFRCYEDGKNISEWEWFYQLIKLVKGKESKFNFDYTFYMVEDLLHTFDHTNLRPFNTVRALKRFDHFDVDSFLENPKIPRFNDDRTTAGRRAADAISSFQSSEDIRRSLDRRKGLKLILMKAMKLRWEDKKGHLANLDKLVEFSVEHLGRFAKMELYFGWKLLKYGDRYRFFGQLMQKSENAIQKLNGMSWDLYSLRHQETMSIKSKYGRFYVPFIATFDRRFKELMKACPIRCVLIDDRDKRINTIFVDEYEFFQDVNIALNSSTQSRLSDPEEKIKRLKNNVSSYELDGKLDILESECRDIVI
ncbi:hypothetical protein [Methylobacter sp.]|uniref:hypothetical protein n=1 Tax=Methylobacter sp. TaxID=2051955 RepID=UPI0025E0CBA9|nr:hypothetical protein [Methylobacter sp.]